MSDYLEHVYECGFRFSVWRAENGEIWIFIAESDHTASVRLDRIQAKALAESILEAAEYAA